ncbi:MAG: PH domain-containing protein, partial [Endomicrobium sp.]|nr:PH domain-containing protein [Endomicrobium sp.]
MEAKKHWLSLLPAFCYTLAAIILFFNMSNLASLFYYPPLASTIVKVWIFLVVIFIAYRAACDYLIFFTSELCFTDQRLIGKTGILRVRTLLTPLNKINHIASSTGILGTFFHYGNIQVH